MPQWQFKLTKQYSPEMTRWMHWITFVVAANWRTILLSIEWDKEREREKRFICSAPFVSLCVCLCVLPLTSLNILFATVEMSHHVCVVGHHHHHHHDDGGGCSQSQICLCQWQVNKGTVCAPQCQFTLPWPSTNTHFLHFRTDGTFVLYRRLSHPVKAHSATSSAPHSLFIFFCRRHCPLDFVIVHCWFGQHGKWGAQLAWINGWMNGWCFTNALDAHQLFPLFGDWFIMSWSMLCGSHFSLMALYLCWDKTYC